MKRAVFFLSTGRCGTQWLARNLAATYPDRAAVEHEPLHDGYRSRELLACPDLSEAGSAATIGGHVSEIEAVLRTSMYIECGWPSWAALPYLAKHFAGRVAIVHLTRHPIPTACSWVTHRMYQPAVIPGLHPEKVPLSPFDAGVMLPEYRRIWDSLDPFQRCLYFWTEVHRFGLELEAKVGAAWLRLRYEDMLSPDGLMTLLEFLDLPPRHALFDAVATPDDQYRHVADRWWDVTSAQHLPRLAETATMLGYDVADVDETALRRRYLGA
jgi:hypothetical protein